MTERDANQLAADVLCDLPGPLEAPDAHRAVPSGTNDQVYEAPRRSLGARREKEIREGLAPGCVWIAFPASYARQLLRELDLTRRERDSARAAVARREKETT